MEKKKKQKKKIKLSIKLIAASLLAAALLANCIYSSFEQVSAQGMFGSVEEKVKAIASSTDKQLKVLEILPDTSSLSVLEMLIGVESRGTGVKSFQTLLASYTSEEIEAFANTLSQYGIINLDSTSSAIYPLTYYKPGDEERKYSNTPTLPNEGYALVEQQLAVGTFEEVDTAAILADPQNAETVYYQEIVKEVSPSTPSEVTASTPTVGPDTPYYFNENNEVVYLKYKETGFNQEIYNQTAANGRFFRFVADEVDENGNKVATADATSGIKYSGYGYRFIFGSKAEIRSNSLFTRFVLGIEDDESTEDNEVTKFNANNMYLHTVSIDSLGSMDLSEYDLVYIANPFLQWDTDPDTGKGSIEPYDFANPEVTDKSAKYSPWVTLDLIYTRVEGSMESASAKLLEGAVNQSTPLKLIVDSSILKDYEKAVSNYESIIDALQSDPTVADAAAMAEDSLDKLNKSEIYKTLLMLAQDDFDGKIHSVSDETKKGEVSTYALNDAKWDALSSEDLRKELYQQDTAGNYLSTFCKTDGHFVNKNLYFYAHSSNDYKKSQLTQNGLIVVQMANGDFRSIMTKALLRLGFTDVVTAIEDENRRNAYLENGKTINAEEISVDMVIQYLLNYKGITIEIKKNTISVLEIQPCADFSYAYASESDKATNTQTEDQKKFINKWIAYFAEEDRYEDVTFTSMSMQEFIGKNEDLNATYDLIYIGSNIDMFPTVPNDNAGVTDKIRRFNDVSMMGYIYTHVGDLVGNGGGDAKNVLRGLLDTDYIGNDRSKAYNSSKLQARTTGNDLTTYKKRDLLNFLASGYPVIVDEKLFTYETNGLPKDINSSSKDAKVITGGEKMKIYLRKAKNGECDKFANEVSLHLWNDSGAATTWPGLTMKWEQEYNGYYWYSLEVDKSKNYKYFQITGKDGAGKFNEVSQKSLSASGDVIVIEFDSIASVKTFEYQPGFVSYSDLGSTVKTTGAFATVDNSTYLYQLLKIATAQEGTFDVSKVTLDTLNSDAIFQNVPFDWEQRTYKNLLVDKDSTTGAGASAEISQFLNETKIYINLTKRPTVYGYETSDIAGKPIKTETTTDNKTNVAVDYLEADADGRYYLDYEFSISTLAGSLNEKDFDCELFVDANFDGKFSENSEFLDSIIIKEASTGKVVSKNDGEDFYRLQEGVAYTLTRKLPKSFDGCINWKLQISENGNDEVVAAETGYCAIPVKPKSEDGSELQTGEKQKIRILQITSGKDESVYTEQRKTYTGTHVNLQKELESKNTNSKWYNLLTNIPDFELEITTVTSEKFANDCETYDKMNPTKVGYYPISQKYDMIIVGFIDAFADVYDGSTKKQKTQYMAEALIQFGNAGKSILFTHDTTAWTGDYQHKSSSSKSDTTGMYNSSYLTVAIRDLCGNDQFGVVTRKTTNNKSVDTGDPDTYISQFFNTPASTGSEYSNNVKEWKDLLNLGKDMAFKPNSNQSEVVAETQGTTYVNMRLANYKWMGTTGVADAYAQYVIDLIPPKMNDQTALYSQKFDIIGKDADGNDIKKEDYSEISYINEKIDIGKINDGAITEYPYKLSDIMEVSSTHAQYWTVDIESDTNFDNESDLVVWYCINDRKNSKGDYVDYYDKSPNDVRNNYYIYNKGNITYTGAGHTPFSGEDEIKLFINTMIAAYNAQLRLPELYIVENGEPEAADLETLIIPYDSDITPEELGKDFVNFGSKEKNASDISGTMKVFFNVYDGNLTAKNKKLKIDEIFITDSKGPENSNYKDSTGTALHGDTYTKSKDSTGSSVSTTTNGVLPIYDADTDKLVEYDELISGKSYYILAPLNTIFANDYAIDLHITMHTIIGEGDNVQETNTVTDKLTISRAEIFDLD